MGRLAPSASLPPWHLGLGTAHQPTLLPSIAGQPLRRSILWQLHKVEAARFHTTSSGAGPGRGPRADSLPASSLSRPLSSRSSFLPRVLL